MASIRYKSKRVPTLLLLLGWFNCSDVLVCGVYSHAIDCDCQNSLHAHCFLLFQVILVIICVFHCSSLDWGSGRGSAIFTLKGHWHCNQQAPGFCYELYWVALWLCAWLAIFWLCNLKLARQNFRCASADLNDFSLHLFQLNPAWIIQDSIYFVIDT